MKLYYDMFIPYMPDAIKDENGELIPDPTRSAGRRAMVELANFQNGGNTMALYQSVIYACTYAGVDLVDTVLSIPEDITFEKGVSVSDILDESAKMLFRSIKPDEAFDIYRFTANVLMAVHIVVNAPKAEETPLPFE